MKKRTGNSEFDISQTKELPRVDVFLSYLEAPADTIKAAVDNGAKGIVIAGAGNGVVPLMATQNPPPVAT